HSLARLRAARIHGAVGPASTSVQFLITPGQVPEYAVEALGIAPQFQQGPALGHCQTEDLGPQIARLGAGDLEAQQALFRRTLRHALRAGERSERVARGLLAGRG